MAPAADRLQRLVDEDVAACRADDVDARVAELEDAASLPTDHEADRQALRTLGDETRYRIVRLLTGVDRELCVCEITPVVDVTESAISHALSDLAEEGLVSRRKEGTWRYYEATERADAVLGAIDETREGGR